MAEMRPEDVAAEFVRAAMAARWDLAYPDTACRSILAAVLPLHEKQLRERAETAEALVSRYQARALLGTNAAPQQPEDVRGNECGDVYHRYDDDPLVCTLDRGHVGTHCGQGAEWPVGHEFGDRVVQQAEDGDRG